MTTSLTPECHAARVHKLLALDQTRTREWREGIDSCRPGHSSAWGVSFVTHDLLGASIDASVTIARRRKIGRAACRERGEMAVVTRMQNEKNRRRTLQR